MGIHIEINKQWFEANKDENNKQYLKKFKSEGLLVAESYIIDFEDMKCHIDNFDGDRTISITNFDENRQNIIDVSMECEINTKEAGILAQMLTKMFNKLKTALETLN